MLSSCNTLTSPVFNVNVLSVPGAPTLSGPSTLCQGTTGYFNTDGCSSYGIKNWQVTGSVNSSPLYTGNCPPNNLPNFNALTLIGTNPGLSTITVYNNDPYSNCNSNSTSMVVTITSPIPPVTVTGCSLIPYGSTCTYTVTNVSGAMYSWNISNGNASYVGTGNIITVSGVLIGPAVISVAVYKGNCNPSTATFPITITGTQSECNIDFYKYPNTSTNTIYVYPEGNYAGGYNTVMSSLMDFSNFGTNAVIDLNGNTINLDGSFYFKNKNNITNTPRQIYFQNGTLNVLSSSKVYFYASYINIDNGTLNLNGGELYNIPCNTNNANHVIAFVNPTAGFNTMAQNGKNAKLTDVIVYRFYNNSNPVTMSITGTNFDAASDASFHIAVVDNATTSGMNANVPRNYPVYIANSKFNRYNSTFTGSSYGITFINNMSNDINGYGYTLENNTVSGSKFGISLQNQRATLKSNVISNAATAGINIYNLYNYNRLSISSIAGNNISNCDKGVYVEENQVVTTPGVDKIRCNTITNASKGVQLQLASNPYTGIMDQGSLTEAAGNKFTGCTSALYNVGQTFSYYYGSNEPTISNYIGAINLTQISASSSCSSLGYSTGNGRMEIAEIQLPALSAMQDSIRYGNKTGKNSGPYLGEIVKNYENTGNLSGLEKFASDIVNCNREAYYKLALHLYRSYDLAGLASKADAIKAALLQISNEDAEIAYQVKAFEMSRKPLVTNLTNNDFYRFPFGRLSEADSIALVAMAASGTSVADHACQKLRQYYKTYVCPVSENIAKADYGLINCDSRNPRLRLGLDAAAGILGAAVPNPASGTVTINYTLAKQRVTEATLTISDMVSGKVFETQTLDTAASEVSIDVSNLPSGIYAYTLLVNGTTTVSKKLVVIK